MAMVMPRSRSSGALSIWSKALAWARPERANVLVIAAVSVVLPWSTCPIVPTLTCGFVRSNFCFATLILLVRRQGPVHQECPPLPNPLYTTERLHVEPFTLLL